MTRVKRGSVARKRRKKILNLAKGFRGSLSKLLKPARNAVIHALRNAYNDRRNKKRDFRALWITRISAGLKEKTISYSVFIAGLKRQQILLNRKILADLAHSEPNTFDQIVEKASK
jgi:large subunit ribosomal protein L20